MSNAWKVVLLMHGTFQKSSSSITTRLRLSSPSSQAYQQCRFRQTFSTFAQISLSANSRSRKGHKARVTRKKGPPATHTALVENPLASTIVRADAKDIYQLFGKGFSLKVGHDVLKELQHRRASGSLVDVGVNVTETSQAVTDEQATQALEWLRTKYPVDEASAAERYAELEDEKLRADLEARALKSFLYKRHEERPIHVQHSVEQWREDKRAQWQEQANNIEALEKKYAEEQAEVRLAVVQQQIQLAERRDQKMAKWDELEKQAELDTDELKDENRSVASRLATPLAFGAAMITVMSFWLDRSAVTEPQRDLAKSVWTIPDSKQLSPSIITCGAITVTNLVLLLAWRNPRLWYSMNRLFLLSAGNPNTLSVLGSVFSHQRWIMHLAANTTLLFSLGVPLHDEIGRVNFMVIYLVSGVFASCSSLMIHVLRRNFLMASLGASGAVMGLYGAFFTVQPTRDLYIPIFQIHITYDSWYAIAMFVILEGFMLWRTRGLKYDHVNHMAGLLAGSAYGNMLRPAKLASAEAATQDACELRGSEKG